MNVAIIGSRDFYDYEYMKLCVLQTIDISKIDYIISGGAKGADSLAERFAKEYSIPIKIFPADWKNLGKSAGFIRNTDIVANSDIILAFPIEQSKGTYDSIKKARNMKKQVFIFQKEITNVWKNCDFID